MASGPFTSWQIDGEKWKQWKILYSWAPKSLQIVIAAMKLEDFPSKESYDKPRQHIKKQRHPFASEGLYIQSYGFSNSQAWMWELDHKEGRTPKNYTFEFWRWGRLLRGPWTARKSNQFIGRTHAEAGGPILWPPDVKNWLIGKDPDAGKDWAQERMGVTEDELVGWHHCLNGHELK